MDNNSPTQLDLVSTEEIINILMSRCNNAIFIGLKPEQYAPNNYWYEVKGNIITCVGLVKEIEYHVNHLRRRTYDVSESQDKDSD